MKKNLPALILYDHPDNPRQFIIIKSGWSDMYHVIEEDPESGDMFHEHQFLSETALMKRYPEFNPKDLK